jgi:hypothetical protein
MLNLEISMDSLSSHICLQGGGGDCGGPHRVPDCQQQVASGALAVQHHGQGGFASTVPPVQLRLPDLSAQGGT